MKTAKAADNGLVFRKRAVAGQRCEIFNQFFDVIEAMRAVWVTRDLDFLRRGQFAVNAFQLAIDFVLQLGDIVGNIDAAAVGNVAKLFNLGFQVGNGFFEFERLHGTLMWLTRVESLP